MTLDIIRSVLEENPEETSVEESSIEEIPNEETSTEPIKLADDLIEQPSTEDTYDSLDIIRSVMDKTEEDEDINNEFTETTQKIKNEIDNLTDSNTSLNDEYFAYLDRKRREIKPDENYNPNNERFLSDSYRNFLHSTLTADKGLSNGWSGLVTAAYWAWEHSPLALFTDEESEGYQKLKHELTKSRLQNSGTLPETDENLLRYSRGEISADDIQISGGFWTNALYTASDLIPSTATTMVGGGLIAGSGKTAGAINVAAKTAKAAKAGSKISKSAVAFAGLNVPKTYRDVYDSELEQAVDRGISLDKAKGIATANALLQTPVEFLGDLILGGVIKSGTKTKNFIKKLVNSGAAEVTEKGGLKIINKGGLLNALKDIGKESGKTFFSEGIEEGLQQFISNTVTNVGTGEKVVGYLEGVGESAWEGGLIGGMFGGSMAATQKLGMKIGWKKEKQLFKQQLNEKIQKDIQTKLEKERIAREEDVAWKQRESEKRNAAWSKVEEEKQDQINEAWNQKDQQENKQTSSVDLSKNNFSEEMKKEKARQEANKIKLDSENTVNDLHKTYTDTLNNQVKIKYKDKSYTIDEFANAKFHSKNNKKTITIEHTSQDGTVTTEEFTGTQKEIVKQLKSDFLLAESIVEEDLNENLNNYELVDGNGKKVSWDSTTNTKYTIIDKSTNTPVLSKVDFTDVQKFKLNQYVKARLEEETLFNKYSKEKDNKLTRESFKEKINKINNRLNSYRAIREKGEKETHDVTRMYDDELIDDAVEAINIIVPEIGEATDYIKNTQSKHKGMINLFKGEDSSASFDKGSHVIGNGIEITSKEFKNSLPGEKERASIDKSNILNKSEIEYIESVLQNAYDNATDIKTQNIIGMFLPVNGEHNNVMLSRLTGKQIIEDVNNPGKYIYYEDKASHVKTYAPDIDSYNVVTVEENASDVLNDNKKDGKVTSNATNPLEDSKVSNNQSDNEKANVRKRANPSESNFSDNSGSGNAGEYQISPGNNSDTSDSNKVYLKRDGVTPGKQTNEENIKDYNDYRKEKLANNISDLSNETKGLVSKNHIKQAVLNLAEKLQVHLDKLSQKEADKEQAVGIARLRERYIQLLRSNDGMTSTHELGHFLYNDFIMNHNSEQDISEIVDILLDDKLISKLVPHLNFSTYSRDVVPSEIFGELFAEYANNPSRINSLRTTDERVGKLIDKIDSMIETLNVSSEFKQIQKVSEMYNSQSKINKGLANIIIQDLPYSSYGFLRNIGLVFAEPSKSYNYYVKKKVAQFIIKIKPDLFDDFKPLERALSSVYGKDKQAIKDRAQNIITKLRFLRGSQSGTLQEFVYGSGLTWDRLPIQGFTSLSDIFNSFENTIEETFKTMSEKDKEYIRELYKDVEKPMFTKDMYKEYMYRQFTLYLQTMNTIGENLGTQEFVDTLMKDKLISITDGKAFTKLAKDIYLLKQLGLLNSLSKFELKIAQDKLQGLLKNPDFVAAYGNITINDVANIYSKYENTIKNNTFEDIDSSDTGLDILDALAIYEQMNNDLPYIDTFASLAQNLYTWQDHVLNYLSRASTTTRHMVDAIRREGGAFHVPLMRSFLEYEVKKQGIPVSDRYKLTPRQGSDRPIINIFDSVIQQVNSEIYRAHIFSSLETLVDFQRVEGSALVLVEQANSEEVDKINNQIKDIYSSLAQVLDTEGKVKFEDKRKVPELVKEINKLDLNSSEKAFIKEYFNSKLQNKNTNISDIKNPSGININSANIRLAKGMIDYAVDTTILSMALQNTNAYLRKDNRYFSVLNEQGNIVTYKMTDEHLLDGIVRNVKSDPAYAQQLQWLNKLYRMSDFGVKAGYTTFNIGFAINNFFKDYFRGLHYSQHYDTSKGKLNIIPQAVDFTWTYVKTALQELLPFKAFGYIDNSVLNQLGLSKATWIQSQKDLFMSDSLSNSKWRNVLDGINRYLESQGTVIRKTEYKLMCKKLGVTPDIFKANPEALSGLAGFSKNTLQRFGITSSNIQNILTPEQFNYFNSVNDTTVLSDSSLNLTEQQKSDIRSLLTHEKVQDVLGEDIITKMYKYMQDVNIDYTRGTTFTRNGNKLLMFFSPTVNAIYDTYRRPDRLAFRALNCVILGIIIGAFDWDDKEKDPRDPKNNRYLNLDIIKKFAPLGKKTLSIEEEDGMLINLGISLFRQSPLGIPSYLFSSYWEQAKGIIFKPSAPINAAILTASSLTGTPYNLSKMRDLYSENVRKKMAADVNAGIDKSVNTAGIMLSKLWNSFVSFIPGESTIERNLQVSPIMAQTIIEDLIGGPASGAYNTTSYIMDKVGINLMGVTEYNKVLLKMNKYSPLKTNNDRIFGPDLGELKEEYNDEAMMAKRDYVFGQEFKYSTIVWGDSSNQNEDNQDFQRYTLAHVTKQMIKIYEDMLLVCDNKSDMETLLSERNNLINLVVPYLSSPHTLEEDAKVAKYMSNQKRKLSKKANKFDKAYRELLTNKENEE